MPRRKPSSNGSSHLRRAIASAAARLMAESGITDYGTAKRKAAANLGAAHGESLPTNEEIETELRTYQALFQDDEQPELLHELRETALELMHLLNDFSPRLRGAVLDGTASRYSPINLMLYADSSKDVEIWLLSRGMSYQIESVRAGNPDEPEARLTLDWDDTPVRLEIFLATQARNQPSNPRHSRHRQSANRTAVEALIAETSANIA